LFLLSFFVSLGFLGGCAFGGRPVDRELMTEPGGEERSQEAAAGYQIGCPDVLEVTAAGNPTLSGRHVVGPDGQIDLGPGGQVRVEGVSAAAAARRVAAFLGLPPDAVDVRVQEYQSQQLYLVGEVNGLQRAVPYQGPETVLDLLRRVGVTPGAAEGGVYVVRSHIPEGRTPQVFHIALRAIVQEHDQRTNICLQPFDQVHVGETGKSSYKKCIPPCLRPLYEKLCGLDRQGR
jgi:polysaccharide export outer membrane protein